MSQNRERPLLQPVRPAVPRLPQGSTARRGGPRNSSLPPPFSARPPPNTALSVPSPPSISPRGRPTRAARSRASRGAIAGGGVRRRLQQLASLPLRPELGPGTEPDGQAPALPSSGSTGGTTALHTGAQGQAVGYSRGLGWGVGCRGAIRLSLGVSGGFLEEGCHEMRQGAGVGHCN